jgi:hypothetical protein
VPDTPPSPPPGGKISLDVLAAEAWRRRWRTRPDLFAVEAFTWKAGEGPYPYQLRALRRFAQRRRLAIRGPHNLGKSSAAAWAVLHFALTRSGDPDPNWKVITTASVWRQLEHYLWPEIHRWARRLRWDRLGRPPFTSSELMILNLRLDGGAAIAATSDDAAHLEGAHARCILYVFDEAKTVAPTVFDAAEGAFAGSGSDTVDEAYALAISTPGAPAGRFYDIHACKPGYEDWDRLHITAAEMLAVGKLSEEWMAHRARQWGKDSPLYQNRVLGEFAEQVDGVIPLAWLEAANDRWREWVEAGAQAGAVDVLALDVARLGQDQIKLAIRCGDVVTEIRTLPPQDTMATVGELFAAWRALGGAVVVDVVGVGGGPVDRLRELGCPVAAFNGAAAAVDDGGRRLTDKSGTMEFANMRAAALWSLREQLDPSGYPTQALPPDDELTGDLTAVTWRPTSAGKILMEEKPLVKQRLGRSPDAGDAVAMACFPVAYSAAIEPPAVMV